MQWACQFNKFSKLLFLKNIIFSNEQAAVRYLYIAANFAVKKLCSESDWENFFGSENSHPSQKYCVRIRAIKRLMPQK
jgi:hypothetical protein